MAYAQSKPGVGRFSVVAVDGGGFVVKDPNGERLNHIYRVKSWAKAQADRLQLQADAAARRGTRRCMSCREEFESEGIHNRLCNTCRRQQDVLGDAQRPFIGSRN